MLRRRVGRGGLVRAAATTAVVAGTASAVTGRMENRRADKAQTEADAQAYREQQYAPPPQQYAQAAPVSAPEASAPSGDSDLISQLKELGMLHSQGILSDEEFASAKKTLLG
ncbi:MAG TPA: SHOCT domain-containing protein [Glaciihabitans sp.]|nr:SHOCT domain-containing protein [Glaciihabitans sp.]